MEIEISLFSQLSFFGEKLSERKMSEKKYNMIFETWKKSPMKFFDLTPKIANIIETYNSGRERRSSNIKYNEFIRHLANVVLAGNKGMKKIVLRETEAGKFFVRKVFDWSNYYGAYMGRLLRYLVSHRFYIDKKISYLFPLIVDSSPVETLRFMINNATKFLSNPNVQAIFNKYAGKFKITMYFHEIHLLEKNSNEKTINWIMENFLDQEEWKKVCSTVSRMLGEIKME